MTQQGTFGSLGGFLKFAFLPGKIVKVGSRTGGSVVLYRTPLRQYMGVSTLQSTVRLPTADDQQRAEVRIPKINEFRK